MSNNDRVEVGETGPPTQDAPWEQHGESLSPEFSVPPPEPPAGEPAEPEAAPPKRRRWRFLPPSLASRLVLFVVSLVIVVVAAAGAATYVALKSFLSDRLDQQVTTLATSNVTALEESLARCRATGITPCPILLDPGQI